MSSTRRQNKTLLGYDLTSKLNIVVNHLIPAVCSCVLYISLFACDVGVVFRHNKDENSVWSSLTLFFMYLPALGSYYVSLTTLEWWPDPEGFGLDNLIWASVKTLEHLLFPVWSMWRYAERLFWSIEGTRTTDENERAEILKKLEAPRTIELYMFLQSYLHSLPQVLLQIFIVMRHKHDIIMDTGQTFLGSISTPYIVYIYPDVKDGYVLALLLSVGVQSASILLNLLKVSVTTAFFQRFKSQKVAGRQYPWLKTHKLFHPDTDPVTSDSVPDAPTTSRRGGYDLPPTSPDDAESDAVLRRHPPEEGEEHRNRVNLRRSSSDYYLLPRNPLVESAQEFIHKHIVDPVKIKFNTTRVLRETSVADGPRRRLYSDTNFDITRLRTIKGLPEDDFAGKLVSVVWWFCFLLTRILAISAFYYFYPGACCYVLGAHFVACIAILLYDVKSGDLKRDKVMFFLFIGYVYLFVVIEFKIQFKRAKLVYNSFFILVYLQNFTMCLVWWVGDMERLDEDFWFRYVFLVIVMGSIFSVTAMCLYMNVIKPKKVVVRTVPVK